MAAVASAALLATIALCLVAAPSAPARPFATGITNLYTNAPLAFQRTHAAGARFVRIQLYWRGTAPATLPQSWQPEDPNNGFYDWNTANVAVANAVAAGLIPVLQIDGAPSWAQRCKPPDLGGPSLCDPDPTALRRFAIAAARHFDGGTPGVPKVGYWQALNEPNLSLFFFPQYDTAGKALSPALYRNLINAFYDGIKAVNPSNLVLAAGLGPIEVFPWTIGPMRFAREMLCMRGVKRPVAAPGCDGGVRFDIFAIQPYTTGAPTHEGKVNDVQLGDLPKLQRLIAAADRAGHITGAFKTTPLWITEFSWDSKPPDPNGLPMKTLTQWTSEALYTAWRAGVSHFFWYRLRDEAPDNGYKEATESGLYFYGPTIEQDRPKKVLKAFRFPFVAFAHKGRSGSLTYWGRTPTSGPGRVTLQASVKGRWRPLARVDANGVGVFRGKLSNRYGRNRKGAVRAVARGVPSVPFPMKRVEDFYHPPFG